MADEDQHKVNSDEGEAKVDPPVEAGVDGFLAKTNEFARKANELKDILASIWGDLDRSIIEPFMPETEQWKKLSEQHAKFLEDSGLCSSLSRFMTRFLMSGRVLNSVERKDLEELRHKDPEASRAKIVQYVSALVLWGISELANDKFFKIAGMPALYPHLSIAVSPSAKGTFFAALADGGEVLRQRLRRASAVARGENPDKLGMDTHSVADTLVDVVQSVEGGGSRIEVKQKSERKENGKQETVVLRPLLDRRVLFWEQLKEDAEDFPRLHSLRKLIANTEEKWAYEPQQKLHRFVGRVVNMFKLTRTGEHVVVVYVKTDCGETVYHKRISVDHVTNRRLKLNFDTHTAVCQFSMKEEFKALRKLRSMITPEQFHEYMVGGQFTEVSKASGLTYIFRKLRPTLVLSPMTLLTEEEKRKYSKSKDSYLPGMKSTNFRLLAGLCLHPASYYNGTFVGAYCPTDDVVAHLYKMRCEEHKFWAKANHHYLGEAEIGL